MRKYKKVKCKSFKILSSEEKMDIVRDFKHEDIALEKARDKHLLNNYGSLGCSPIQEMYEDELYDYADSHMFSYLKEDDWSGEKHLYSFQKWYEAQVSAQYYINGEKCINEIRITTEHPLKETDDLYVFVDINNPSEILSTNVVNEYDKLFQKTYLGLSLFVASVMLLVLFLIR